MSGFSAELPARLDFFNQASAEITRQMTANTEKFGRGANLEDVGGILYKPSTEPLGVELVTGTIDAIDIDVANLLSGLINGTIQQHQRLYLRFYGFYQGEKANVRGKHKSPNSNEYTLMCGGETLPYVVPYYDFRNKDTSRKTDLTDSNCTSFINLLKRLEPNISDKGIC